MCRAEHVCVSTGLKLHQHPPSITLTSASGSDIADGVSGHSSHHHVTAGTGAYNTDGEHTHVYMSICIFGHRA
jgi:hypothetical protein